MKLSEVKAFIEASNGKLFSIKFIKRTDGKVRSMVCRTGVKKHLTGKGPTYDAASHGLIVVYDMVNGGYRSIPEEGITEILIDGKWHSIERK